MIFLLVVFDVALCIVNVFGYVKFRSNFFTGVFENREFVLKKIYIYISDKIHCYLKKNTL